MSEHPNVARMREGYEAFAKGDLDTLRQQWTDDIVWHEGGHTDLAVPLRSSGPVSERFSIPTRPGLKSCGRPPRRRMAGRSSWRTIPARDGPRHRPLAIGQPVQPRPRRALHGLVARTGNRGDELRGDAGRQDRLAGRNPSYGIDEVGR